jgi:hypothetical protein
MFTITNMTDSTSEFLPKRISKLHDFLKNNEAHMQRFTGLYLNCLVLYLRRIFLFSQVGLFETNYGAI